MKLPNFLKKGDQVGVVSTAKSISSEQIQKAVNWLIDKDLIPVIGKTIDAKYHQFAGDDILRITDLQQMITDPNIKAIWCARGGYGTTRILDRIDFSALEKFPKWVIGYSDVTALHLQLHALGMASVHATMPINLNENTSESLLSLENVLFGHTLMYEWESSFSYPEQHIQAEIIGGNLSIIYSLLGSSSMVDTQGKILFLEDLDEYLYHIDRMMLNLKRNGLLKGLKAILIGSFTKIHDNEIPFGKSAQEIIYEHCSEYGYPIISQTPAGHIDDNKAILLGSKTYLFVKNNYVRLQVL